MGNTHRQIRCNNEKSPFFGIVCKSRLFHPSSYIIADRDRIPHSVISGKCFMPLLELGYSCFFSQQVPPQDYWSQKFCLLLFKVSSREPDDLARFAGSDVVLDYLGERCWDHRQDSDGPSRISFWGKLQILPAGKWLRHRPFVPVWHWLHCRWEALILYFTSAFIRMSLDFCYELLTVLKVATWLTPDRWNNKQHSILLSFCTFHQLK